MLSEQPPEIDTASSNIPSLKCPDCGDPWLHHAGVSFFSGGVSDVYVDPNADIETDPDQENPSSRRSGMLIEFWCEQCGNKEDPFELAIAQHKGQEHVYWME